MLSNGISAWASKQDSLNNKVISAAGEVRGIVIQGAGSVEDNSNLRGQHKQNSCIGL